MTTPTQAHVRAWARAQGMTVNDRGSLPTTVVEAYAAAHTKSRKGRTVTTASRKATKTPSRKPAKAAAKPPRARKATAAPARRAAAAKARVALVANPQTEAVAPPPGTIDLAGGLRAYLGSIDVEVRAVSALSERIDALVTELNDLRAQQSKRLVVLDELRASVTDQSLGSFLDQAIKPRKTRAAEVVPERLI